MKPPVAAPAEEPTDDCNHLPLSALRRTYHGIEGAAALERLFCGRPCVQEFTMTIDETEVRFHRCKRHAVPREKLGATREDIL